MQQDDRQFPKARELSEGAEEIEILNVHRPGNLDSNAP